jgi:hypothetical protein
MRCDDCGCDIPRGQEVKTTRSEQTGPPGVLGARTSTQTVTLCRRCAHRREVRGWMIGCIVALLFFGGIAVLIFQVFQSR